MEVYMTLKSAQELSKLITSIGRVGAKLSEQIQVAAVNAVGYSIIHGDIRFGQQLLDNMPKGTRRASLLAFLEKYGQFVWMSTEKKLAFHKREGLEFDAETLMHRHWNDAKAEAPLKSSVDVLKAYDAFIKRLERDISKDNVNVQHIALLDELKLTAAAYNSQFVTDAIEEDNSVTEDDLSILRIAA